MAGGGVYFFNKYETRKKDEILVFCWREDALMTCAAKTWESKLFAMAKLSSNYNPSVVAFGKWQFLGDFTK